MSTGKRLAKRSILGTKVMVPGIDDLYHSGIIQAIKTHDDGSNRYSVRFEEFPHKQVFEFLERDIVGPGFRGVNDLRLNPGQVVYVTHNHREMQGKVVRHNYESQDVLIKIGEEEETVLLKIDDVRLLESRKSARLVNSDTDFSKLADVTISNMAQTDKKYRGSKAIEVPRSDYVQIAGSRKRRTSEHIDDEEVLSECSAAMLLMKLSCSPHSPAGFVAHSAPGTSQTPIFMDLPSPTSSSGASSFRSYRSPTPSPPLSSSVTDEGIVKDLSYKDVIVVYQCTFPGCRERYGTVREIEGHVRKEHLHRPEQLEDNEDERDHEEEFYYTEVEVQLQKTSPLAPTEQFTMDPPSKHMSSLSLADHIDMARPPHEDPRRSLLISPINGSVNRNPNNGGIQIAMGGRKKIIRNDFNLSKSLPTSGPIPVSIGPTTMGSPGKLILISPPSRGTNGTGKSPNRRPRDGKKCRKVYGLEQRDQWCTQCKWKKACARFGANATEPLPQSIPTSAPHVKAIKF